MSDGGNASSGAVRRLPCHQFTPRRPCLLVWSDPSQLTKAKPAPPEHNNAPAKLTAKRGISIAKVTIPMNDSIIDMALGRGEANKNTRGGGSLDRFLRDGGGHSLYTATDYGEGS